MVSELTIFFPFSLDDLIDTASNSMSFIVYVTKDKNGNTMECVDSDTNESNRMKNIFLLSSRCSVKTKCRAYLAEEQATLNKKSSKYL